MGSPSLIGGSRKDAMALRESAWRIQLKLGVEVDDLRVLQHRWARMEDDEHRSAENKKPRRLKGGGFGKFLVLCSWIFVEAAERLSLIRNPPSDIAALRLSLTAQHQGKASESEQGGGAWLGDGVDLEVFHGHPRICYGRG